MHKSVISSLAVDISFFGKNDTFIRRGGDFLELKFPYRFSSLPVKVRVCSVIYVHILLFNSSIGPYITEIQYLHFGGRYSPLSITLLFPF